MAMDMKQARIAFWIHAVPFVMVYAVVWGVAGIALPLVAGSAGRAGLVFAMLNLGVGIAAPLWGHFSKRVPVTSLAFLSTLLAGASWAVLTLLGNLFLPLMALLFGLFASGIFALATVQVTNLFPTEMWDTYIARMQSVMVVGQVVGLLATSLYAGPALGLPFLLVGIIGGLVVARGALAGEMREIRKLRLTSRPSLAMFPGLLHAHYFRQFRLGSLLHFRNRRLAVVLARWTLLLLAWAPIFAIYPLMMHGAFAFSGPIASLLYSGSTALSVPLFLMAGAMARRRAPAFAMTLGALVSVAAFALMYLATRAGISMVGGAGFVLMVCSYAFVAVGMNDGVVSAVSADQEGEALGVANALMSADNVVGGIAGGSLVAAFGYAALFEVGFALSAIALALGLVNALAKAASPESGAASRS